MRTLAFLVAGALLLSGCASHDHEPTPFTCPDGTVVQVPANHTAGPGTLCPPPAPPAVTLSASPARIWAPVALSWSVASGGYPQGHSMLTMVRSSTASKATSELGGPDSFGEELVRKEHQNLPVALTGEHTFRVPGTYYLRAYAAILAEGLPEAHYWSPEVTLVVADVAATGNNTVVTHPIGNSAGTVAPNPVNLRLGDGIVLKNDDLVAHTFTPANCASVTAAVSVPAQSSSEPLVFKAPGTCAFTTDDLQPQTLTVNVSA